MLLQQNSPFLRITFPNVVISHEICANVVFIDNCYYFCDYQNIMRESANITENVARRPCWPVRVFRFYVEGFKGMTVGKTLWTLILIKLFFIFVILKLFFFPNHLKQEYDNDRERAEAVRQSMLDDTRTSPTNPVN